MPEIKRVFTSGRMNKDIDERLIENGEYRDALNIQVLTSQEGEAGNAGTVQNIIGNLPTGSLPVTFVGTPIFKGACKDTSNDYIYWFVKDDANSYLFEYNPSTPAPTITLIIQDNGNNVFKFDNNLITGISFFEGFIALTDNVNEPKLIDVDYYKTNGYAGIVERDITVIKEKPKSAPYIHFETMDTGEDQPYELKFVRFGYRWKFKNGQYSVFSPFSTVAFDPGIYAVSAEDGYNLGMQNNGGKIALEGIYVDYDDIESVDILMKKSDDATIYVVETIKASSIDNSDTNNLYRYRLTAEQIYSIVSSDQLLRLWDAVPLKALAQEFIANRLIFGNYELGEDTDLIDPEFSISLIDRGVNRQHIKTNRTYQFGIVFEDYYGRQTPVIANKTGSINIPFGDSTFLTNPKQFRVQMLDTSDVSNFTSFKYFIKDTSGDYYNVFVDAIFPNPNDPTGSEVWMALPSTEINKFEEGDFLLLKKGQNSMLPIANPEAKFKAIAVESNAPDFIGTDYSGDVNVTSVTNFNYLNYSTSGRFFVRLEDKNNILSSLYINNGPVATLETITNTGLTTFYPQGIFLGKYREADGTGASYRDYSYYLVYNSATALGEIKVQQGSVVYQSGSVSELFPEGTLQTSNIDIDGDTNLDLTDFTNPLKKWYKLNTQYTGYADGLARDVYVQWQDNGPTLYQALTYPPVSEVEVIDPAVFETEAKDQFLDIYYETEETWPIAEYGNQHDLRYFNSFNFQNGVESNRIRDDFNAPIMDKQVRVSTVIAEQYMRFRNAQGLIWSDIYNGRTNVNKLNQFSAAQPITKDLSPEYGSIQKLHARDYDLVTFCEDKIFKIQSEKDVLYNADGSSNVALSSKVLGAAVPVRGEFGISKNPESFAEYGYRIYFTDKARGVVLRMSLDGLEVISNYGMNSYFTEKFRDHIGSLIGSYDVYTNQYVLSFENDESLSFAESSKGWVSRLSYIQDGGEYLNGKYYTFKNGVIYLHSKDASKNTFYEQPVADSTITFIYNEEPSTIKNFYTLGYEGSEGWEVSAIHSDLQNATVPAFVNKEGKYFGYIRTTDDAITDLKQSSVKGIGTRS
jgi:hypothetical protein